MIPFKELQNLADNIRTKLGKYCYVSVEHNAYSRLDGGGDSELCYVFYTPGKLHLHYATAQDLKRAMNQIINPETDEGISVKEEG